MSLESEEKKPILVNTPPELLDENEDCIQLQHDKQIVFQNSNSFPFQLLQSLPIRIPFFVKNLLRPKLRDYPQLQCAWLPYSASQNLVRVVAMTKHNNNNKQNHMRKPELIISSQKIDDKELQNKTCQQICKNLAKNDCQCVIAQERNSFFDSHSRNLVYVSEHVSGGHKYFATTTPIRTGFQVFSMFSDILDTSNTKGNHQMYNPQKRLQLTLMPDQPKNGDLMFGTNTVKNVLLKNLGPQRHPRYPRNHRHPHSHSHLHSRKTLKSGARLTGTEHADMPASQNVLDKQQEHELNVKVHRLDAIHRLNDFFPQMMFEGNLPFFGPKRHSQFKHKSNQLINVILKLNKEKEHPNGMKIKMTAVPLVGDHQVTGLENRHECLIQNSPKAAKEIHNQCSFYVDPVYDYDIRIQNLGSAVGHIELFTVKVPRNQNNKLRKHEMFINTLDPDMMPMTREEPWQNPHIRHVRFEQRSWTVEEPVYPVHPLAFIFASGLVLVVIVILSVLLGIAVERERSSPDEEEEEKEEQFEEENQEEARVTSGQNETNAFALTVADESSVIQSNLKKNDRKWYHKILSKESSNNRRYQATMPIPEPYYSMDDSDALPVNTAADTAYSVFEPPINNSEQN